ncbi:hypothetical protein ACWDR3_22250 [Streptomyces sp. NPDC001002]
MKSSPRASAPMSPVRAYLREVDAEMSRSVEPGPRGQDLLRSVSRVFRDLGVVRLERVGSARCGTSVSGFSDVDVLVVFVDPIRNLLSTPGWLRDVEDGTWEPAAGSLPYSLPDVLSALAQPPSVESSSLRPSISGPPDPARVFDEFVERFTGPRASVEGFAAPRPDFPAVTFVSECGEPSIELVPGLEADFLWDDPEQAPSSGLSFRVFPGTRERWLGTHPELHDSTLTLSPGGDDYTCREMIRHVKLLLKYSGGLPLRSYFIELFVLRWVEGSHDLPARTVEDILDRMAALGRRPYAHTRQFTDDIRALLDALSGQLRTCAAEGRMLDTVDLTTPETQGQTEACASMSALRECAEGVARIREVVVRARYAEEAGDVEAAVALWRRLLHPVHPAPHQGPAAGGQGRVAGGQGRAAGSP